MCVCSHRNFLCCLISYCVAEYRREDLKRTLRVPLDGDEIAADDGLQPPSDLIFRSIVGYLDDEKLGFLSASGNNAKYREKLRVYLNDRFYFREDLGKYVIGLEASNLYWLLDVFHKLAQADSISSMHRRIKKILDKLILLN